MNTTTSHAGSDNRLLSVLTQLDAHKDLDESKLIHHVHENAHNLNLSFAEKVLLLEGSQLGIADCTIPPYVEFENLVRPEDKCIRSEIAEWALGINTSKLLFKSGMLSISGAHIMTSGTFASLRQYDDVDLLQKHDRYSLDLRSRDIAIDLRFEKCLFYSGINISNSYCENLIFEGCRFGAATDRQTDQSYRTYSINATSTHVKGDFIVDAPEEPFSRQIEGKDKKPWKIMHAHVDFSYAEVCGQLKIKGFTDEENRKQSIIIDGELNLTRARLNFTALDFLSLPGILRMSYSTFLNDFSCQNALIGEVVADNIEGKIMDFYGTHFSQNLDYYSSRIANKLVLSSCIIKGGFYGDSLQSLLLDMSEGCIVYGAVRINLAKIDCFSGDSSFFMGYPVSINAAGLEAKDVFLREGCCVFHGGLFYKSTIHGDFDCSGALFGPSKNEDSEGTSVSLGSTEVNNIRLCNGFTAYGKIDVSNTLVGDTLSFRSARVLAIKMESGRQKAAIYAPHLHVKNMLNFNLNRSYNYKIHKPLSDANVKKKLLGIISADWSRFRKDFLSRLGEEGTASPGAPGTQTHLISDLYKEVEDIMSRYSGASLEKKYEEPWRMLIKQVIKERGNVLEKIRVAKASLYTSEQSIKTGLEQKLDGLYRIVQNDFLRWTKVIEELENYAHSCKEYIDRVEQEQQEPSSQPANDKKKFVIDRERIALIQGEADFEHAVIEGEMDCAGAIFRPLQEQARPHDNGDEHNLVNALNMRFAKVNGPFFINGGYQDLRLKLPFIAEGDIDLQNASLNSLFISTAINRHRAKWRMTGASYNYITDDNKEEKGHFHKAGWIHFDKSQSNYRQPFEQFSNVLFQSGEDILARDVLVLRRPHRNCWERLPMAVVKGVYKIGKSIERAVLGLVLLYISGVFCFGYAYEKGFIIAAEKIIAVDKNDSTNKVETIQFDPRFYALQRLIPFFNSDQKEHFIASYSKATPWYFNVYHSILYPLLGLVFVSAIFLSLHRMRKGNNQQ